MKKIILLLTALSVSTASAATVSVASTIPAGGNIHGAANGQVVLKDAAGNVLPSGMRIRVGFFVGYSGALDATLRAPGGALELLSPNSANRFIPLGEPPTRVGYGDDTSATNLTKTIAGTVRWNTNYTNVSYVGGTDDPSDDNTTTDGGVARGTKLFVMVYNTEDLNAGAAPGPGFEYGLFSADNFLIPQAGSATTSLNVALVDTPLEVYWGLLATSLHTAPIPEPATGLLAFLACAGFISRRRR